MTDALFLRLHNTLKIPTELQFFGVDRPARACKMGLSDLRDSRCESIVLIKAVIVLL